MYDLDNMQVPTTLMEAVKSKHTNPEAVFIAGGTDVLIKMREGKLAGKSLISLHDIKALKGVTIDDAGMICIRPATTFSHITYDPIIQKHLPMLGLAVDQVGGPQIRNMGTIGGNICNGVTSADSASTLFTYNAELEIVNYHNLRRRVSIHDFYKGPGKVDLNHIDLLTAIYIKKEDYDGFHGHYIKYAMRNAMDIATLGCAVNVKLDETKQTIQEARLAFGVAGPTPMRCPLAEAAVCGQPLNQHTLELFSETALTEVNPRTSWRASKEFRLQLVKELSHRGLMEAIHLGGGQIND
ncbi:xanthine dehydrogenase subunit XdhB [Niameybacter massiliensis]|uniref:xanthine dehydrogenase subunit XdhB n=1 Tax=Niameybacter massiliensis TaxID=1658108 RepID=UPI0006B5A3E3|nr:xanthine dehydrogenase subunit XdhB [Niameybacter massiliensis]